jgi:hypothetical protein
MREGLYIMSAAILSTWEHIGYEEIRSGDGSPTVRALKSDYSESMHHKAGAWSETQYIYGQVIDRATLLGGQFFVSVGLGIGYNDLLVLKAASTHPLKLVTYESDPALRDQFLAALQAQASGYLGDQGCSRTYAQIFSLVGFHSGLAQGALQMWERGDWKLEAALNASSLAGLDETYQCLLFDAYSQNTTPELWTDEFLCALFQRASKQSVMTTYACTGRLKRQLLSNGFQVQKRPGFAGKRDSTLAVKGWSLEDFKN